MRDKRKELQEIKGRKDATMIFWICLILDAINLSEITYRER